MAKSRKKPSPISAVLEVAADLAQQLQADKILVMAEVGVRREAILALHQVCSTLVVTQNKRFLVGIEDFGIGRLTFDFDVDGMANVEWVRQAIILGMEGGFIQRGSLVICVTHLLESRGVDSVVAVDTSRGFEGFYPDSVAALAGDYPIEVVKAALDLAVDIGQEGREGDPIGALFVIGDSERVLTHSRTMTFDPFRGYSEREKNICNADNREGIKEVARMDGAFVIQDHGVVVSGSRYISADVQGLVLPKGLGARHVAAASITKHTRAIAIAVSQSTGVVRAFKEGKIVLRVDPSRRSISGNWRR